jgi:hypothetical protein
MTLNQELAKRGLDDALLRLADHRVFNMVASCLNLLCQSSDAQIDARIAVAQRPCSSGHRARN